MFKGFIIGGLVTVAAVSVMLGIGAGLAWMHSFHPLLAGAALVFLVGGIFGAAVANIEM